MTTKEVLKRFLGEVPFTAELYWLLRQNGRPVTRFSLKRLQEHLPPLIREAKQLAGQVAPTGRHIDRKSTRLNSSHVSKTRIPSSA